MGFSIELRPSHLKLLSTMLANIATGLIFLPVTTLNPMALTVGFGFAIVCIKIALKAEDLLREYD